VGAVKGKAVLGTIDSPSGFDKPGERVAEPMSERDIEDAIAAFARAAADASAWALTPSSCTAPTVSDRPVLLGGNQ